MKNRSACPGLQTTPFCFINWLFYHVRCKNIETSIFNVNGDSLPGSLIIGTFEKRAPSYLCFTRFGAFHLEVRHPWQISLQALFHFFPCYLTCTPEEESWTRPNIFSFVSHVLVLPALLAILLRKNCFVKSSFDWKVFLYYVFVQV